MKIAVRSLWLVLLATPVLAGAQVIADRTTLNSIVGVSGKTVDFESFSVGTGGATSVPSVNQLDSTTIANTQGPNLVPSGVTFSFGSGNLQWDDAGYYSAPSREILSTGNSTIEIRFSTPAKIVGLDVRAFSGFAASMTATVYSGDNSTVLSTTSNLSLATSGSPIFFGYQSPTGIGKLVLSQTNYSWSPIIDNLTFSVIPEPPAFALLGGGLALLAYFRRRWLVSRGPA